MANKSSETLLPPHGGQLRAIAERFSVSEQSLLDFSASIYPLGPSLGVLEALTNALQDPERIRAYPDLDSLELREGLASYAKISPHNILVANGMTPLLTATLRALHVRRCMLPIPTFGEYRRTLRHEGIAIETYGLANCCGFQLDFNALLAACSRQQCDTVILTNPHNPTGLLLGRTELLTFAESAEAQGIRVLLDEAFIDFVPEESVSASVSQLRDLYVFRSVTKFFSMAGMRIAYMIAPEQHLTGISNLLDPWPISTLASIAAVAAVTDAPYIATALACNRRNREMLELALAALGVTVYPSAANFLFFRIHDAQRDRNVWQKLIVDHGVVIRNCATFERLNETYFRVAVRGRDDNRRLTQALDAVLNGP